MQANSGVGLGLTVGFASLAINYIRRRALTSTVTLTPPVLPKRPKMVPFGKVPGENRGEQPMEPIVYLEDPYYYVRDDSRTNEEILDHLRAENAYTKAALSHLEKPQDDLYKELLGHVQETDQMVPYPHGDYLYYTRTEEGKAYRIHCRKPRHDANGAEEILLDVNQLAEGQAHCDLDSVEPSPDHKFLAYSVDFTAYETYDIYIKDLTTSAVTKIIQGCDGSIVWGADASTLFYVTQDGAHRSHKVWKHTLGTPQASDMALFTEVDEMFSVGAYKTTSGRFFAIASMSKVTSEIRVLDLRDPAATLTVVAPRVQGVKYTLQHWDKHFLITTNRDGDVNFKLMSVPVDAVIGTASAAAAAAWTLVFPYDSNVKVAFVIPFKTFFVLGGRQHGLTQRWICGRNDDGWHKTQLAMPEPMYSLGVATNAEYDAMAYRFTYSSLTTPVQTVEYNVATKQTAVLKETPVPHYDRTLYDCERIEATATDGTAIPISIIYRKDHKTPTGVPQALHLYGYGSYEASIEPNFRTTILPLLDRGVIYAIAHIRGGGENGRTWYESAKYLTKMNTFTDFIACAEHLVASKMTTPAQMTCEGRSAGGLLMGAVLNRRPDLFTAAIAGVPFVDVMNTISDATIPLTTGEWAEWGNPNELQFFAYMLQYSPYENVKAQAYPNMLVTGGLFDPRVPYWEPTKWVAKLRDMKTDDNQVLLKMDLDAGHFSASDRYHYLKEKAVDLSFILDQLKCLGP
ncbi:hypothetical protein, variant 2 [Aphanomyces invadans]|uniref:Prolyl endopeptidase n=1 Tax=Aphanomyces invadans TaxID=157072 RepID=A0A024UN66_9STRA|nr:hypothetical protein, variant 2 [Aphanomyces invadans]ETW07058.1 hypothetical protein, variant 2 [Aphanomyces invadans]|eukprot:XP_008865133.1 hypothetical protein, variant 2 [Aphanomyces invadans]